MLQLLSSSRTPTSNPQLSPTAKDKLEDLKALERCFGWLTKIVLANKLSLYAYSPLSLIHAWPECHLAYLGLFSNNEGSVCSCGLWLPDQEAH